MVAPNKRKGSTNYDIELRNQQINPKPLEVNNCNIFNGYCFLTETQQFISKIPEAIHNTSDFTSQIFDLPFNVNHIYADEVSLDVDQHFSAILAETAYILTDSYNTNNSLPEKFKQKLDENASIYTIHQETIKNSTVLEANSEYVLIKDERLIVHNGKIGNACHTSYRGTDLTSNQTLISDVLNDAYIFFGFAPASMHRLNKEIPEMLNRHPECIFNIATGHSLGASKSTYLNEYYDLVYAFEPGQTNWSSRYRTNLLKPTDNSNITEFRVSCDMISKGTGPFNGNVYHLVSEKGGIRSCHSMNIWIKDAKINNKILNFKTKSFDNEFSLSNFKQEDPMSIIAHEFYDSIQSNINVNQISNNSELPKNNKVEVEKPENKDLIKYDKSLEIKATKNLTTLNQGLSLMNGISHFYEYNDREKALFITSTILDQMKNNIPDIFKKVKNELNVFGNMLTSFIQDGKIRVEQVIMDICQNKFGVPLNGVKMVLESITHHGRNLKKSIKSLITDCIIYSVPYAQVVFLVYQSFKILKSFLTHTSVIEIGGFSLIQKVHASFGIKKGYYHTVTLTNNILDITITSRQKHTNDAYADADARFKQEAQIKAYQVYGIDYEYFNDLKDNVPENRYEKYKQMLHLKLTKEYWKIINDLSEEEKIKYENAMFESDEMKTKRIKFKILGKKFSYYYTNKSKDIYHFVCDLRSDFFKCKNNTERAMFLYSLFLETGNSEDNQLHFSKFTKIILELFGIDVVKLEKYINHQNKISDKDLDEQVKKKKEEESKDNQDFLIKLRNKRTKAQNESLTNFNNDQKKKKENNEDEYSLKEIRKFAHNELLKYEISAEFVFQTLSSSVTSNFLFSMVYFDKEYLRIKKERLMYIPNKSIELTSGCIQSYTSTIIANHISLDLSLREKLLWVSDDAFQYLINPNIQLLTSVGVSSLVNIKDRSQKNKNMGHRIYDISENVLKTNGMNIIKYYSLPNIEDFKILMLKEQQILSLMNTIDYSSFDINVFLSKLNGILFLEDLFNVSYLKTIITYLLGSTFCSTLSVMIVSRILRSIIFPEIKPAYIDFENLKDIEETNKDTVKLIKDISDSSVSNQKKKAIKKELELKGIIEYEKLPIKKIKIFRKRNIYSGKDLIF